MFDSASHKIYPINFPPRFSFDVEPYHVEIVEWHLMTVSTENVHVVVLVNVGRVSVTSRWTASNHAELGLTHGRVVRHCEATSLSALTHLLVVSVEGVVSILNDEGLLHRDRSGRRKSLLFTFLS